MRRSIFGLLFFGFLAVIGSGCVVVRRPMVASSPVRSSTFVMNQDGSKVAVLVPADEKQVGMFWNDREYDLTVELSQDFEICDGQVDFQTGAISPVIPDAYDAAKARCHWAYYPSMGLPSHSRSTWVRVVSRPLPYCFKYYYSQGRLLHWDLAYQMVDPVPADNMVRGMMVDWWVAFDP